MRSFLRESEKGCNGSSHPEKGVSALDAEGQKFFDPAADEVLFRTLEEEVRQTAERRVTRHPFHINDPEFSGAVVDAFLQMQGNHDKSNETARNQER